MNKSEINTSKLLAQELRFTKYGNNYYFNIPGSNAFSKDIGMLNEIIFEYLGTINTTQVDTIRNKMKVYAGIQENQIDIIALKNGFIQSGEFIEGEKGRTNEGKLIFTPFYVDMNYKEDCQPVQEVVDFVNNITDEPKELFKSLGHILSLDSFFMDMNPKFFVFETVDDYQGNLIFYLIEKLLGCRNISKLDLNSLSKISNKSALVNITDVQFSDKLSEKNKSLINKLSAGGKLKKKGMDNGFNNATTLFFKVEGVNPFEECQTAKIIKLNRLNIANKDLLSLYKELTSKRGLEYFSKLVVEGYFGIWD